MLLVPAAPSGGTLAGQRGGGGGCGKGVHLVDAALLTKGAYVWFGCLQEDLGIGPLGHRDGLLQAICDLQHHFQQRASRGQGHMPRVASRHSHIGRHRHGQSLAWNGHISSGNIPEARPGTAPVGRPQTAGPEVGVKVTQWRDHLARDLERALARAERRRMCATLAADATEPCNTLLVHTYCVQACQPGLLPCCGIPFRLALLKPSRFIGMQPRLLLQGSKATAAADDTFRLHSTVHSQQDSRELACKTHQEGSLMRIAWPLAGPALLSGRAFGDSRSGRPRAKTEHPLCHTIGTRG